MNLGRNRQIPHIQNCFARDGILFVYFQLYRTTNHHIGKLLLIGFLRIDGTDILALSQHRNAIRNSHNFV